MSDNINSANYGYWLHKNGILIPVFHARHAEVAQEISRK